VKEKLTFGSPFFWAFPSGRIPKTTKDVNVRFFLHSRNSRHAYQRIHANYTSEFQERFEATTYNTVPDLRGSRRDPAEDSCVLGCSDVLTGK